MSPISVVIPLYNKALHIGRTLESALRQTVPSREIIVVDDGSTDGSGEIVKSFEHPSIRIVWQENQGEGAARNRGISESRGEVIAFLDADDVWKPRFLEVISELIEKFPHAGAYATDYEIINPDGSVGEVSPSILPPQVKEGIIDNYFRACSIRWKNEPVWSSAVAVRKKVLQEIGGFPVGKVLGVDLDTWARIALRYPIAWSSERLSVYHQDALNRLFGFKPLPREPILFRTLKEAIHNGMVPAEIMPDVKEFLCNHQLSAAAALLFQGERDLALKYLLEARDTKQIGRWWAMRLLIASPKQLTPILWEFFRRLKKVTPNLKYLR